MGGGGGGGRRLSSHLNHFTKVPHNGKIFDFHDHHIKFQYKLQLVNHPHVMRSFLAQKGPSGILGSSSAVQLQTLNPEMCV